MRSTTIVSTLLGGAAALKVVQFDIRRVQDSALDLTKRDTIDGPLANQINQYNLDLTIGTPPQNFSLQLDTGSSDLWVNVRASTFCSDAANGCVGGLYDASASTTYQDSDTGNFSVGYVDKTSASGVYGEETVVIGGVAIVNQTFGVAEVSDIPAGLIGVAFPDNEGVCDTVACPRKYPTIVDSMVAQGKINSRAYSLWLNDLNASTGSVLFGGIDTSKYQGGLVEMNIIPDLSNDTFKLYKNFNVIWSNLTITGYDTDFFNGSDSTTVTLDSGTSLTYIPPDMYDAVAQAFNVSSKAEGYTVDCSLRGTDTTFDFTLGGSDGAKISVPIAEFVLDNTPSPGCYFGIFPSTDPAPYLFGDTFLRSAYVVYDLDTKHIAIAQANFDGGEPNIQEIMGDIPDVSSTAGATGLPPAATSAMGTPMPIGPVTPTVMPTGTATGSVSAPPATYTGAGAAVQAGSKYLLGYGIAALPMIMAL